MSDSNEPREETQQEAGSAQANNAERAVEATDNAKKLAQEKGMDLAGVEGTGPGGRITKADVERAHQRSDRPAESAEKAQSIAKPGDLCIQGPCIPGNVAMANPFQQPTQEAILEQYAVLTAILGSPDKGFFNLEHDNIEIVDQVDPLVTHDLKVIETDAAGNITRINFPGAHRSKTPFANNFFAPMPPSAPVTFPLPHPQPLLPSGLNSCQCCLDEKCDPCGVHIFEQFGLNSPSRRDPYCGGNQS